MPKKTAQGKCRLQSEPRHRTTLLLRHPLRHLDHARHNLRAPCQTPKTYRACAGPLTTAPEDRRPQAVSAHRRKAREGTRPQQVRKKKASAEAKRRKETQGTAPGKQTARLADPAAAAQSRKRENLLKERGLSRNQKSRDTRPHRRSGPKWSPTKERGGRLTTWK